VLLDDRRSRPTAFTDSDLQGFRSAFAAEKSRAPAAIQAARRQFLEPPRVPESLIARFATLADLGLADDAFRLADQWSKAPLTSFNAPHFLFLPDGVALRRDPRFIRLAAKIGLVDYWRATGKWPDFCAQPGMPYDCKAEAAKLVAR
jgi:hypothetical protein